MRTTIFIHLRMIKFEFYLYILYKPKVILYLRNYEVYQFFQWFKLTTCNEVE